MHEHIPPLAAHSLAILLVHSCNSNASDYERFTFCSIISMSQMLTHCYASAFTTY